MSKRAIVLLSGGLDSAVSLWWAKKKGYSCVAINFDYGQRHIKEIKSAKRLATSAKIPLKTVRFSLPWSASSLTSRSKKLPQHKLSHISTGRIPSTYVPARNTIFLSFAMSWADQIGAEYIVMGANAIDYSGYPDCRLTYLNSFEKVAQQGSRLGTEKKKKIKILAPLLKLTKAGIFQLGYQLKVPIHLTWSCYQGGKKPCGKCDSCKLRDKGFKESSLRARQRRARQS